MLHLKNFSVYAPESAEDKQIQIDINALFYRSEDGRDWYQVLPEFQSDTFKIKYHSSGAIMAISRDATTICPQDGNVVEVSQLPSGASAMGGWIFDVKTQSVIEKPVSENEQIVAAEAKRGRLMSEATTRIDWLADALADGDISADEETELASLRAYRAALRRMDLTAKKIKWPEVPQSVA